MAIKKFTVREGFSYRITDETGAEHILSEGDTIDLPEEIGTTTHQLELADPKQRAKATAAEAARLAEEAEAAKIAEEAAAEASRQAAADAETARLAEEAEAARMAAEDAAAAGNG